ncbi:MAG: class II fructose-bisphosphate aldolase [Spirochaetia bacterium]
MKKQNLNEELHKAERDGYAVPAFNFNDIWDLTAIIRAAEDQRSPVMVMAIPRVVDCLGREACAAMALAAAAAASVPVFLHLDHCKDVGFCKVAVDLGFPSVMIDASALPLEQNIAMVKEVCQYARSRGVCVEAELGRVSGTSDEGSFDGESFLIQVDEALRLVGETGVDSLAVGIGTAHGFYKAKPKIRFDRLQEVNAAVDIPLVLHGGTGIPTEDFHRAIENGIDKVNIGTALRSAYVMGLKPLLAAAEPTSHPLDIHARAREGITLAAIEGIRSVRANGKA